MELHVVINGRKDLAEQLYQQLREAIATGRLSAGAQLPPSRLALCPSARRAVRMGPPVHSGAHQPAREVRALAKTW